MLDLTAMPLEARTDLLCGIATGVGSRTLIQIEGRVADLGGSPADVAFATLVAADALLGLAVARRIEQAPRFPVQTLEAEFYLAARKRYDGHLQRMLARTYS